MRQHFLEIPPPREQLKTCVSKHMRPRFRRLLKLTVYNNFGTFITKTRGNRDRNYRDLSKSKIEKLSSGKSNLL